MPVCRRVCESARGSPCVSLRVLRPNATACTCMRVRACMFVVHMQMDRSGGSYAVDAEDTTSLSKRKPLGVSTHAASVTQHNEVYRHLNSSTPTDLSTCTAQRGYLASFCFSFVFFSSLSLSRSMRFFRPLDYCFSSSVLHTRPSLHSLFMPAPVVMPCERICGLKRLLQDLRQ